MRRGGLAAAHSRRLAERPPLRGHALPPALGRDLGGAERLATPQWGTQRVAADLDGDGRPELVTGHPDTPGVGVHTALGAATTHPTFRWTQGLAAGDLDGDGLVDLVTGSAVLLQKR